MQKQQIDLRSVGSFDFDELGSVLQSLGFTKAVHPVEETESDRMILFVKPNGQGSYFMVSFFDSSYPGGPNGWFTHFYPSAGVQNGKALDFGPWYDSVSQGEEEFFTPCQATVRALEVLGVSFTR